MADRFRLHPFSATLVLVPTVRHGDQFRRRLLALCGVALGLRVETPRNLAQSLCSDRVPAAPGIARELLAGIVRREAASGAACHLAPIAATPGLQQMVWTAIDELTAEEIDAARLTAAAHATGDPPLVAIAGIYAAYRAALDLHRWLHPAALPGAAAATAADSPDLPRMIAVDGFTFFHEGELQLLAALARSRDLVLTFDPDAGTRARHSYDRLRELCTEATIEQADGGARQPAARGFVTSDREAQLRAIARSIKRTLTEDRSLRPSDCGVTFRRLGPTIGLARQIFAEYDLPLDPVAGEPLANRPLGIWVRRLLRLPEEGWRLRDLIATLSSGFIDRDRWGLDAWAITSISRRGRKEKLWAGREALERLAQLTLPPDAQSAEQSLGSSEQDDIEPSLPGLEDRGLGAALTYLYGLLQPPPAPAGQHAERLNAALFGESPLIRPHVRLIPGLAAELDALRRHLDEIATADAALGAKPIEFSAFADRLLARLEAPAAILREAGGVLLAPMTALAGLRLAHLAVGGLVEGEFPLARSTPLLLSSQARRSLAGAGIELPPDPESTEDELWRTVRSRADRSLTAWRTRLDERGRHVAASLYFDDAAGDNAVEAAPPAPPEAASHRELAVACTTGWTDGGRSRPAASAAWDVVRLAARVEQRRRSFADAGAFEGWVAAELRPDLTDRDAVWSATRLETYQTCPFQFFGRYALDLYELEEEQDAADPAIRGTVMHEMLQDALSELVEERRPLTPDTVESAIERLRANGRAIWQQAPYIHGFGRVGIWELECEPALERLEAMLRAEAERSAQAGITAVQGAELPLHADLPLEPPLKVRATIDRLDSAPGATVIVDYKSGHFIGRSELGERRFQLQLYAYLAREHANAGQVIARYAWVNPKGTEWQLDSADAEDRQLIDDVVRRAADVRAAVRSGEFRVDPKVRPCPRYCAYQHVCRVNEFSRWKRWQ